MTATVDLRFEGEDVTSFHSLDDTGQVIYVGSFSKIIAPGMRMGYLVAPEEVIQRAMSFKGGGGVNQFAALAIEEYLKRDMYRHIDEQNQSLRPSATPCWHLWAKTLATPALGVGPRVGYMSG